MLIVFFFKKYPCNILSMNDRKCSFCQLESDKVLELSTHLKMQHGSEIVEMMKQRDQI